MKEPKDRILQAIITMSAHADHCSHSSVKVAAREVSRASSYTSKLRYSWPSRTSLLVRRILHPSKRETAITTMHHHLLRVPRPSQWLICQPRPKWQGSTLRKVEIKPLMGLIASAPSSKEAWVGQWVTPQLRCSRSVLRQLRKKATTLTETAYLLKWLIY